MKSWISTPEGGGLVTLPLVSALDHGFTVGDGIFEALKTENGKPFLLDEHLLRLQKSAEILEIAIPDLETIKIAVFEVLGQSEIKAAPLGRIRITVSTGPGELGSLRADGWTLVVVWTQSQAWPESAKIIISDVVRNERSAISGAKTISYAENVLALQRAKKSGASEAIMLNLQGNVCEGTGSNVFIVKNKVVLTPPAKDGILVGITRDAVIASIPPSIRFAELSFSEDEMLDADEIFLTSSTRNIQPVTQVGEKEFAIGPITKSLMQAFSEWIGQNNE